MIKILVSACLLGQPVRYDGGDRKIEHRLLDQWVNDGRAIAFCPEVAAGLPVPRVPAEIQGGNGDDVLLRAARVMAGDGVDVSDAFISGAEKALALCRTHHISMAILTDGSPSCGSTYIYDGRFCRSKMRGHGVTTALLLKHNIPVFSHTKIDVAGLALQ